MIQDTPTKILFLHRPMIQRKLTILSQAGLAKEDFSGATNTVIRVNKYCTHIF